MIALHNEYNKALATVISHELFHHAIGNSTFHGYKQGYVDAKKGQVGGALSPAAAKSLRKGMGY